MTSSFTAPIPAIAPLSPPTPAPAPGRAGRSGGDTPFARELGQRRAESRQATRDAAPARQSEPAARAAQRPQRADRQDKPDARRAESSPSKPATPQAAGRSEASARQDRATRSQDNGRHDASNPATPQDATVSQAKADVPPTVRPEAAADNDALALTRQLERLAAREARDDIGHELALESEGDADEGLPIASPADESTADAVNAVPDPALLAMVPATTTPTVALPTTALATTPTTTQTPTPTSTTPTDAAPTARAIDALSAAHAATGAPLRAEADAQASARDGVTPAHAAGPDKTAGAAPAPAFAAPAHATSIAAAVASLSPPHDTAQTGTTEAGSAAESRPSFLGGIRLRLGASASPPDTATSSSSTTASNGMQSMAPFAAAFGMARADVDAATGRGARGGDAAVVEPVTGTPAFAAPAGSATPLHATSAASPGAGVHTADVAARFGTPAFAPALATSVNVLLRDGIQEARLNLHPAEMGPIAVQIALEGTQARVDFTAEVAATRTAIEAGLPELASALRESGLTLTGGGVFEQAREQRQPGAPGAGATPNRSGERGEGATEPGAGQPLSASTLRRIAAGGVDTYA